MLYFNDAEKAFDWAHWGFMKAVLKRLGFGQKCMTWVSFLYLAQSAEVWIKDNVRTLPNR